MAELVRETYAQALFEVAVEVHKEENIYEELYAIYEVFKVHRDLTKILKSPALSREEKKAILVKIFAGKVSDYVMNFIKILIDKGRMTLFEEITKEYKYILNQKKNIEEVTAITAIPMSETMRFALSARLTEVTGKNIFLHNVVDETILGGVLLKMGNEQMDGSVKSRLDALCAQLSSVAAK